MKMGKTSRESLGIERLNIIGELDSLASGG